ncbi:MAG: hypothetical protein H2056_02835 [Sphingopyxis sp.]|nr:hypothetical protein [Sphingopyxis sp.]
MTTPTPNPPPPASDTVRRLQVGVGGVAVVLLLVGLAEIISDRTADSNAGGVAANADPAAKEAVKAEQPLVELGVQPDTEATEAPKVAPPPAPKTAVPDLAPDPALQPARPPER